MVSISGSGTLPPPQPVERKIEARPAAEPKPVERAEPQARAPEAPKEEPRPRVDILV